MLRIVLMSLGLAACAAAVGAEPAPDPAYALPGDYAEATTVAEFQARFGEANVEITGQPGEGGFYHRVVLFPDDPSRRAYVDFYEDDPLAGVHGISVRDAGSKWRGKHGVHVGMSLAELRRINGKPFYFSGFDENLQAVAENAWSPALDDNDGTLGALDVAEGEHMYFGVTLGPRPSAGPVPVEAYPHEEASVSSDDPRYPRLGELFEVTGIRAYTSLDDEW
jgi:hypothetical protein